jgi:hypothetical protein
LIFRYIYENRVGVLRIHRGKRKEDEMPAPVTTCDVCKQEVLKAQTYHIGNGKRACRKHDGVAQTAEKLRLDRDKEQALKLEQSKEREKRKEEHQSPDYYRQPRCWLCKIEGMMERDLYQTLLIQGIKEELEGVILSPFSEEYRQSRRKALGIKEGETLEILTIFPLVPPHLICRKLDNNCRQAVGLAQSIILCTLCAERNEFKKEQPPVDLNKAMVAYRIMKPALQEMVKETMAKEKTNA